MLTFLVNCQCGERDGYYPHPAQCDKYLICERGQVVEEALCPDGLVFNDKGDPSRIRCELGFNIDCSLRPSLREFLILFFFFFFFEAGKNFYFKFHGLFYNISLVVAT